MSRRVRKESKRWRAGGAAFIAQQIIPGAVQVVSIFGKMWSTEFQRMNGTHEQVTEWSSRSPLSHQARHPVNRSAEGSICNRSRKQGQQA